MRKKIYQLVHVYEQNLISIIYKYCMMVIIILSLIPLTAKNRFSGFFYLELFCVIVFIADYLLRWLTADYKLQAEGIIPFLRFPFRLIALIDLMSILALLSSLCGWFRGAQITQVLTVFRIVRLFRYSKNVRMILDILKRSRRPLTAVGSLAVGYIFISAIIMFNVEPDSFNSFFDAVYWSTVSLTTVGYGDIYPVSAMGRLVAMLSSFFGIAIVALPAGIVTAEYLDSIKERHQ